MNNLIQMLPSAYPSTSISSTSSMALVLFCFSLLLVSHVSEAGFDETHLRGPFIRRHGLVNCPDSLYFERPSEETSTDPFNLTASSIYANDQQCTSGSLSVTAKPFSTPAGGELASYMTHTRDVGQVIGIDVTERIFCSTNISFNDRAYFTLLRTEKNITVDWRDVFLTNNTKLEASMASQTYTFEQNVSHVVINAICLYTTLTQDEFNAQRGEACFPTQSSVYVQQPHPQHHQISRKHKSVSINQLKRGDQLLVKNHTDEIVFSDFIGWSHYDTSIITSFIHIETVSNSTLTVSHGHFVYITNNNSDMTPVAAKEVKVGMQMKMAPPILNDGRQNVVKSVKTVWRIGLFNPHTSHGDIIVNGFVCTTYTEAIAINSAHALLTPIRFITSTYHYFINTLSLYS